ncbi:MAG: hydrogenase formation protein HypD [Actinobacteria bacterium]|nr:hydrogenase formation protein HypD [Actinomycetota bacterium]
MIKPVGKEYFHLLTDKLHQIANRPLKIMEVCGTHTMAIGKAGIREILPLEVELVSGPGCPVCVTADADIDTFMRLAEDERVILATYGDMMRIPGTKGSLAELRAQGADVRVVYSALEVIAFARSEPDREIVFLGIGFETTAPATAHAVVVAEREDLTNFSIYNLHKTVPEALRALLEDDKTDIDGFILPGHVSVIIGEVPYAFIAKEYGAVGAIAGFEPPEIMAAILKLVKNINASTPAISNLYRKVVRPEGNMAAKRLLEEIFVPSDAEWRGLGIIPESGLALREGYERFDATRKFNLEHRSVKISPGCRCGEILKGIIRPHECPLFSGRCTPERPVGPCMVSSEGTCAAYYLYHGKDTWRRLF